MKKIALLHRMKKTDRRSIEAVFRPMDKFADINRIVLPCDLNSVTSLIKLIFFAFKIKEKNIHIAGDIHFMAVLLFWKCCIITVHDCNYYEGLKGFKKKIFGMLWFILPLKLAKKVVVISPYVKDQILAHFSILPQKIQVIPNSFNKIESSKEFKNENYFTIIAIGTKKNKNLIRLIKSVRNIEYIQLVIIGVLSREQLSLLKGYKIKYVNAFNVSREELIVHYNKADLLFFGSTKEGFGLPILEAQSCGIPIITSNTTSMPYVAGKGACFVNPYSTVEIENAILKIKNDEEFKNDLINYGYSNIKRFSEEAFVKSYVHIYDREFNLTIT